MDQPKVLKRPRVDSELKRIFQYPLTIVEAPIGFGKTTAVREFLAAQGCPVLWLTFLSAEDTPNFFWNMFSAQVGELDERVGIELKRLGFPSDSPQTSIVLSILSDLEYKENTTLVIDDFQLAADARIGGLLENIVKENLDDLHIVIITRDTSNLNLAELVAKGFCNILPQKTLRFTDSEMCDYCVNMGFHTTGNELSRIVTYTGGWIAFAYLILRGMEQDIPIGWNSALEDLVEKVLYNTYDASIQKFLIDLSVMDAFTVEQACYVTGESHAGDILRRLRRENAFISFDEPTGVYKIHNVLLDFLRARREDGAETDALYRRLGEWYVERKVYKQGYGYLCRAGENSRVLAMLNDEDAITNDSSEFEGAMEMFAATPRPLFFKYPLAYLQYIAMLFFSGNPEMAQDGTLRLGELEEVYTRQTDLSPARRNCILGEISTIRIFSVFNDAHKMMDCIHRALRLREGAASCLMKRDAEFTFGSPHFLYTYYTETGRLRETADFIASEFPLFARLSNGCGTGCDYVVHAEYALETGEWQSAEINAFKAFYKAKTKEQTGLILCAGLVLIRLYIYQGRIDEALEYLRQLRTDVTKENSPVYNTTLELVEGYVYGCLMRLDSIPEWLQTGDMRPAHFMYQGMAFNYIVHGKAVLLSGKYIRLEMLAEECGAYFSVFQNQLGFLHNQILDAVAKYRLYGMEKGCDALQKAIGMAREDHLIMPFAEYASAILDMLRHAAGRNTRDAYIQEILRACERYMESVTHASQYVVSLTEREQEVLTLTAEGLKRSEIAARLYVSDSTVKTHLENIYRKLEVNGKTQAVRKAQKLKLL